MNDTIIAVATPPGRGGVSLLRLSGPKAYSIGLKMVHKKNIPPREAIYTSFFSSTDEIIDKGLVLYFKAPHSFTGEDVFEFQGHGSPVVIDFLMQECITLGARLAHPGEFSARAFYNDKIDLTQAEAIADLIQASSLKAARLAVRSLQGDFSKEINALSDKLIHLRLFTEAMIDFPDEDLDDLENQQLLQPLKEILRQLQSLRANASQGALIREGLDLVIAGRPNAGKSTLINQLAGKDLAIVTHIPGTTRDVMRESILLDDLPVQVVDTAGLRETDDLVEQEGIRRAWLALKDADVVLIMIDAQAPEDSHALLQAIEKELPPEVPLLKVYNKVDCLAKTPAEETKALYISAKSGQGIFELKQKIKQLVGYQPLEGSFLARRRHLDALDKTLHLLQAAELQMTESHALELFAEDLREAHQRLMEITGKFSPDDLLGKIFSSFCIGK